MAASLETLLAVQERDLALDRLTLRRRELPERAKLAELQRGADALDADLAEVKGRRDALVSKQTNMEAEIAAAVNRVHQIESRMYGGEVSASRDLQAMSDEVRSIERRRANLEDQVIGLMEEVEPLEGEVFSLETRRGELERQAAQVREELAVAEAAIDSEMADEQKARAELAHGVPPELAERYEAIRRRLGGVGAARLTGGSCGGCHLALPAMELERVRHAPAGEVIICDQCGRILVP